MAPSSEMKERFSQKIGSFLPRPYKIFKSPAALELRASINDKVGRSSRLASNIPDSMFSCVIKTVGPSTETYVPSGPVEISISTPREKSSVIEWSIPVPSNFLASNDESLPVGDANFLDEDDESSDLDFFEINERPYLIVTEKRKYATIKFGGSAQEEEISKGEQLF
jgi:hypothetical protein